MVIFIFFLFLFINFFLTQIFSATVLCGECSGACTFILLSESCLVKGSHLYSCQLFIYFSESLWLCRDHWGCCCPRRDAHFAEAQKKVPFFFSYWIPLLLNSNHVSRWTLLEMEINGYLLKQKGLGIGTSGWLKHSAFRIIKDGPWK